MMKQPGSTWKISLVILLALMCAHDQTEADEAPAVVSVEPSFGFIDTETRITVRGAGFDAGVRPGLLDASRLKSLGEMNTPGWANDVAVDRGFAFVADGDSGVQIVNIRELGEPVLAGTFVDSESEGYDVATADGFAYVADGNFGLRVLDVRVPEAPVLVGAVDTPGSAVAVALADGFAFVAAGEGGLQILDIREPAEPALAGAVELPGWAHAVVAEEGLAVVAVGDSVSGLVVIDVSDPAAPFTVSSIQTTTAPGGIALADGLVYFTTRSEFAIYDLREPTSPVPVGSLALEYGGAVSLSDGFAFVTGSGWRPISGPSLSPAPLVRAVDIRNPASPSLIDTLEEPLPGWPSSVRATGISVSGGVLYVAGRTWTYTGDPYTVGWWEERTWLRVIDARDPGGAALIGSMDTPGGAWDLSVADYRAFVLDGSSRLHVIDVGDSAAPVALGSIDMPVHPRDVAVAGGFAFVAAGSRGLEVVDVQDPESPRLADNVELPGYSYAQNVALSDGFAYVADLKGLQVIDVRDPGAAAVVGFQETPDRAEAVAVEGDLAYVVDEQRYRSRLRVIDVGEPEAPAIVGTAELLPSGAVDIAVSGGFVYVTGWTGWTGWTGYSGWFRVIDVRDPEEPAIIGVLQGSGGGGLSIANGFAYVANPDRGILVIDVRDPASPALVGSSSSPGRDWDVEVAGGFAYVADTAGGLQVIRLNPTLQESTASANSITATVPAGFAPGAYDVAATNPDGARSELDKGFRLCERRDLQVTLENLHMPTLPELSHGQIEWRVSLEGDERLFAPRPLHRGVLLLPELPPERETIIVPTDEPGRTAIELHMDRTLGMALVKLIGQDAMALRSMWAAIEESGDIALASIDARHYGALELEVHRVPAAATAVWSDGQIAGEALVSYRYEFTEGSLVAARARGSDTDHVFEARATYDWTCEVGDSASYVEAFIALCEEQAAEKPWLAMRCAL